jgi:serine/threonine-protein kinase
VTTWITGPTSTPGGCLAWEALAGRHPFADRAALALIGAQLTQVPRRSPRVGRTSSRRSPRSSRAAWRRIPRPPADASEVLRALDGTPPGHAAAAPHAGADTPRARVRRGRVVAVLPFANMSAEADNAFFSDGITEDVIGALTQVPGLRVAARASAFAFRGRDEELRVIGERLGVRTVLQGSVRRAGNRVRVTAQLMSARRGSSSGASASTATSTTSSPCRTRSRAPSWNASASR